MTVDGLAGKVRGILRRSHPPRHNYRSVHQSLWCDILSKKPGFPVLSNHVGKWGQRKPVNDAFPSILHGCSHDIGHRIRNRHSLEPDSHALTQELQLLAGLLLIMTQ